MKLGKTFYKFQFQILISFATIPCISIKVPVSLDEHVIFLNKLLTLWCQDMCHYLTVSFSSRCGRCNVKCRMNRIMITKYIMQIIVWAQSLPSLLKWKWVNTLEIKVWILGMVDKNIQIVEKRFLNLESWNLYCETIRGKGTS